MDEVALRGFIKFVVSPVVEPAAMDMVMKLYTKYVPRLMRSTRYYLGVDGHLAAWRRRTRDFIVDVILFQEPIEGGYLMISPDGKSIEEIPAADPPPSPVDHLVKGGHVRAGGPEMVRLAEKDVVDREGRRAPRREWARMIEQALVDNGRGHEVNRGVAQVAER